MAELYRYVVWLLRNGASARARDKESDDFREEEGKTGALIIAEWFLKAVVENQSATGGKPAGITGG